MTARGYRGPVSWHQWPAPARYRRDYDLASDATGCLHPAPTCRRRSALNRRQEHSNHHEFGARTRPHRLSLRRQNPQIRTAAPAVAHGLPPATRLPLLTQTNPRSNWLNPSDLRVPQATTRRPNPHPAPPPRRRPDPHNGHNRSRLNWRSAWNRAGLTQGSPNKWCASYLDQQTTQRGPSAESVKLRNFRNHRTSNMLLTGVSLDESPGTEVAVRGDSAAVLIGHIRARKNALE